MPRLRVHVLPDTIEPAALAGRRCVVIDVLRATTTIVHALAAGARAVIPCLEIEEARRVAARFPPGEVMLGGERGGLPIDGFQLGNSPAEYTREAVAGKTIVLTTTNGTRALLHCRDAHKVLVGAFVNLSALCTWLHEEGTDADVVCAGTARQVTEEDVLFAGAVAARLADEGWELDDSAIEPRAQWQKLAGNASGEALTKRLVTALGASLGGQNLIEIGMKADLAFAADLNRFRIAPCFDAVTGRVTR